MNHRLAKQFSSVGALVLLLLSVPSHPLWAETTTADTDAVADDATAQARDLFNQGVARYRSGDIAEACAAFEAAHALRPHFAVLYNIAQCRAELEQPQTALQAFQQYLVDGGDEVPAERRAEVEREVERLAQLLGRVEVTVQPEVGASIVLDGQEVGPAPLTAPLFVTPEPHRLIVRAEGYLSQERSLLPVAGGTLTESFVLQPEPRPQGRLLVRVNIPGATVALDGESVGTTPLLGPLELDTGTYDVEVHRPGYRSVSLDVTVPEGAQAVADVVLQPLDPLPEALAGLLQLEINEAGATVLVDGQALVDGRLPVGPHSVEVQRAGFVPWTGEVQLVAGSTVVQQVELEPTTEHRPAYEARLRRWKVGFFTSVGVAVATLGTTLGLFVWNSMRDQSWHSELATVREQFALSVAQGQDTSELQARLEAQQSLGRELSRWGAAEWTLLSIGMGASVTAALLLLTGPRHRRATRLRVMPQRGGLSLGLTWSRP